MKVSECKISRYSETWSLYRNIGKEYRKSFTDFFLFLPLYRPLQLSCVYTVWFGTQNTTATEKRYFIRKPVFV